MNLCNLGRYERSNGNLSKCSAFKFPLDLDQRYFRAQPADPWPRVLKNWRFLVALSCSGLEHWKCAFDSEGSKRWQATHPPKRATNTDSAANLSTKKPRIRGAIVVRSDHSAQNVQSTSLVGDMCADVTSHPSDEAAKEC